MLFERIFKGLNASKVKYLVVGGIAVNLYGYVRATGDMDIIISFDDKNIQKFIKAVKKLGLIPRIPVKLEALAEKEERDRWVEEKNLVVFSVHNPKNGLELLDIVLEHDLDFDRLYKKRVIMRLKDLALPLISIDDLIKMKQQAGRGRDDLDVEKLKVIKAMHNGKKK